MKIFVRILTLVTIVSLVFAVGCSDRGTNSNEDYTLAEGGPLLKTHVFFDEFIVQIKNEFQLMPMAAYVPRTSWAPVNGGNLTPVPMLILLPPQGRDEYFYFNHGLQQIADELISTGQIQPMAIVCISNDPVFGGYFYGSRYPGAGDYDALVGRSLVEFIYNDYCPFAIDSPDKRAIGGIGQGAYGAFRAAILNPGTFCSISAVDGPLDFDGPNGDGGFVALFDDLLVEQGLFGGTSEPPTLNDHYWVCDSLDLGVCVDSTEVGVDDTYEWITTDTLWPPSWRNLIDSTSSLPLSRMIIGASLAFSPHDTAVVCTTIVSGDQTTLQIAILERHIVDDTVTLIKDVVKEDVRNFDFHLPFDSVGNLYHPIWDNYWAPNNLENLLAAAPTALDNVNMWVATSDQSNFGFHQQTLSWINILEDESLPVTTKTYQGYDGYPATGDEYVYDLLREMLIFHSECFGR